MTRPGARARSSLSVAPELNTQYRHAGDATRSHNRKSLSSRADSIWHQAARCFSMRCTSCRQTFSALFTRRWNEVEVSHHTGNRAIPDVRLIASTTQDGASGAAGRVPAALSVARREPHPRAPARRSAGGHTGARRSFRSSSRTAAGEGDRRRVARLDAAAQGYAWPGNIRELRTVLERAVLLCKSTVLEVDEEQLNEALSRGQLSPGLAAWFGWDGRGLARQAPIPRPSCGGQAHSPRRPAW